MDEHSTQPGVRSSVRRRCLRHARTMRPRAAGCHGKEDGETRSRRGREGRRYCVAHPGRGHRERARRHLDARREPVHPLLRRSSSPSVFWRAGLGGVEFESRVINSAASSGLTSLVPCGGRRPSKGRKRSRAEHGEVNEEAKRRRNAKGGGQEATWKRWRGWSPSFYYVLT